MTDSYGNLRQRAEAAEKALAAADATCDRVLMDDGGNLVPEALLRAAESRCAELEHDRDVLLLDGTRTRLAEAVELLRRIQVASAHTDVVWIDLCAFLAEGDT
jgi:hypothetical protein